MLDYLIKNGRIVDGSGKKLYIASIGISNGKIITNVSEDSEAIEIIDAMMTSMLLLTKTSLIIFFKELHQ